MGRAPKREDSGLGKGGLATDAGMGMNVNGTLEMRDWGLNCQSLPNATA
ncbi:hypothetical protein GQ607_002720 [Colletotrichum asianum]|uniref:Uncharacterized protein n=1 Tax=Colletotrichum asianum TaxID=702518 RepID=A0A8H3WKY4_9PEZI|nr:hypothetical protein GQ607_002720 [Colletotrichum asianum]